MRNLLVTTGLIVLAFFILAKINRNRKWTGFYYPEGAGGNTTYSTVNQFNSYEECLSWIEKQYALTNKPASADWECGRGCRLSKNYKYLSEHSPQTAKEVEPSYFCRETK